MTKFASLAFIQNEEGKILGIKGKYGFGLPGGKEEKGESPLDTLKRELFEETGLSFEQATPIYSRFGTRYYIITFLCTGISGEIRAEEGSEVGWFYPERFIDPLARYPEYNRVMLKSVPRRIFIVGDPSEEKKKGLAKLVDLFKCPLISSSSWIEEKFGHLSQKDRIRGIRSLLFNTPNYVEDRVSGQIEFGPKYVIIDDLQCFWSFANLYRLNYDYVIIIADSNHQLVNDIIKFSKKIRINAWITTSKSLLEVCRNIENWVEKKGILQ